jgi:hypothetical protein
MVYTGPVAFRHVGNVKESAVERPHVSNSSEGTVPESGQLNGRLTRTAILE